jgi:hypothetical protein
MYETAGMTQTELQNVRAFQELRQLRRERRLSDAVRLHASCSFLSSAVPSMAVLTTPETIVL